MRISIMKPFIRCAQQVSAAVKRSIKHAYVHPERLVHLFGKLVDATTGGSVAKLEKRKSTKKSKDTTSTIHVDPYWFGYWSGIDPLDGALAQRSFVPNTADELTVIGRQEYFNLCSQDMIPEGGPVEEPENSSDYIPGVLNGIGIVNENGHLNVTLSLTCANERGLVASAIPAWYEPVGDNLIVERAPFRIDAPQYFHRMTTPYN